MRLDKRITNFVKSLYDRSLKYMQVIIGPKYQVVIPKEIRRDNKNLRPGAKVDVRKGDGGRVTIDPNPIDWVRRTRGIAKETWKEIDPIAELEKGRDEWEERLQELEKEYKRAK